MEIRVSDQSNIESDSPVVVFYGDAFVDAVDSAEVIGSHVDRDEPVDVIAKVGIMPGVGSRRGERVLKIYSHNTIKSAIAFIDEVRRRLPVALQRIKTDHGSEFGTDPLPTLSQSIHQLIEKGFGEFLGKLA